VGVDGHHGQQTADLLGMLHQYTRLAHHILASFLSFISYFQVEGKQVAIGVFYVFLNATTQTRPPCKHVSKYNSSRHLLSTAQTIFTFRPLFFH
jgi:hypothetical protein